MPQLNITVTNILIAVAVSQVMADTEDVVELPELVVQERRLDTSIMLLPDARETDAIFGFEGDIMEIPRAVDSLTAEALEVYGIDDLADLELFGAGTQQQNNFGIAGSPTLRGTEAGFYYNGMLRAYYRNAIPYTFNAAEAIDLVKGPAPAHLIPTRAGGYLNIEPKHPYFDELQGEVKITVGSDNYYRFELDGGGPVKLFNDLEAGWRASLSVQRDDTYYHGGKNDHEDIYAALEFKPSKKSRVFAGFEYGNYDSTENVGWNRPTQNLIDNGQYVVGSPLSLSRSSLGGLADRTLIGSVSQALVLPASVVSDAVSSGSLTAQQEAAISSLIDLSTADLDSADIYNGRIAGIPDLQPTAEGYLYTQDYINVGGKVFTAPIDSRNVLISDGDFAEADDFVAFMDYERTTGADSFLENKIIVEYAEVDKRSNYGYAFSGDQFIFDDRLSIGNKLSLFGMDVKTTTGVEFRYTDAKHLEDFWDEPYPRTDLTNPQGGSDNIQVGPDDNPATGNNWWSGGFGGRGTNNVTELYQYGAFGVANIAINERLNTYVGLRGESAQWEVSVPGEADNLFRPDTDGHKNYLNGSVNPVFKLTDDINLYGAVQYGTNYVPGYGGTLRIQSLGPLQGEDGGSFAEGELYEFGAKGRFFDQRLYTSLAFYYWDQTSFSARSGTRDPERGKGVEAQATWAAAPGLTLQATVTAQRVNRRASLGFRADDWGVTGEDEEAIALGGSNWPRDFGPTVPENNQDMVVPGTPEVTASIFAHYQMDNGIGLYGGPTWTDGYWHNFDRTLRLPSALIWNAGVSYERDRFEVRLSFDNLTDEEYFLGADPYFGANAYITPAPGRQARLSIGYKF